MPSTRRSRSALAALVLMGGLIHASCGRSASDEDGVLLFAAASLADVLGEVEHEVWSPAGLEVAVHYAGSRMLGRQIARGAPADIIVAADPEVVAELVVAGLVGREYTLPMATNRLVVVGREGARFTSPEGLVTADRIALADPALAPAGRYAREWLEARGLWASLADRVVPVRDVRAALVVARSGHVSLALVYATDATSAGVPVLWKVPPEETPGIEYEAALVRSDRPQARRAFEWLEDDRVGRIFARHGFGPPVPAATGVE